MHLFSFFRQGQIVHSTNPPDGTLTKKSAELKSQSSIVGGRRYHFNIATLTSSDHTSEMSSLRQGMLRSRNGRYGGRGTTEEECSELKRRIMALRLWASSTANALKLSTKIRPQLSLSRCFSSVLEGFKYAESHEWVKHEGSVATIGITDHAQDHLGELVFVELPEPGTAVAQGKSFGNVESVKATSEVNSPISGEVVETNPKLGEAPGLINTSPYEEGWMIKIKPSSPSELDSLMGPEAYTKFCEEDGH